MQCQQTAGKRFAVLIALVVFLQSFLALHTHAVDIDSAPAPYFHDCASCMLSASADDDEALLTLDTYSDATPVSESCHATTIAHSAFPFGLPRYTQPPRAPPAFC